MSLRADMAPATSRSLLVEGLISVLTALSFVASSFLIRVNPRDRLGQISGVASLEWRFFLFALVLLAVLLIYARIRAGDGFERMSRFVCAAAAGLSTGLIAGGILVALRGTHWGLMTEGGDMTRLSEWARAMNKGETISPLYPPLPLYVLAKVSHFVHQDPDYVFKYLQIIGTALFGPCAYLSWRLLLRPAWALGIGVIATLPLVEPYKPYANLVLVLFVPLSIVYLQTLRSIAECTLHEILRKGLLHGAAFGVLFIGYSGWFQWCAPGFLAATMLVFPWRSAPRAGAAFVALSAVVFVLITGNYLAGLVLDPAAKVVDNYVYFDVRVEPMYIAMWRNDLPGINVVWPPTGELGGVGVFTVLLIAGLGVAVALGRKTTIVIGLGSIMVGAWLWRFWYASSLWATKLVQLYPRTTPLILYCFIVLAGFGLLWSIERISIDNPVRGKSGLIGAVCGVLLLTASAGASTVDRYMPSNTTPPGAGFLAWSAHETERAMRPRFYTANVMKWLRRPVLPSSKDSATPIR